MTARRVSGFTLIEALVALVVISLGLLGLLALQTSALMATDNARYASLGQIAIDDMADRIRANPNAGARPIYAAASPADNTGAPPAGACGSAQTPCAPAEMARLDRHEWQSALAQALPAGQGFVDCAVSAQPCPVFRITVGWQQRAENANNTPAASALCRSADHAGALGGPCLVSEVRP